MELHQRIVSAPVDFGAIRSEFGLASAYPAEASAEARDASDAFAGFRVDRTDLELVTIDPPGAMDLDQAVRLERTATGFTVHYAIADVAAVITPDGALARESGSRGQTFYLPDGTVPLHPPELSEGSASLLPEQTRPAALWTIHCDTAGEPVTYTVERALVRSRARLDYAGVQADADAGRLHPSIAALPEFGQLRIAAGLARGAIGLRLPSQSIVRDEGVDGHWQLVLEPRTAADDWNEQISLLTGMVAARIMLRGNASGEVLALLRTMPPPAEAAIAAMRRTAAALGVAWPADQLVGRMLADLDPNTPAALVLMSEATGLLRGAGYTILDGDPDDGADEAQRGEPVLEHSAIGAPYAHVTAPLRRLGDRFATEICLALCAETEVPQWVRDGLTDVVAALRRSDTLAGKVERACVDLTEATLLSERLGAPFQAVVIRESNGNRPAEIFLPDPPVLGPCTGSPPEGTTITATLTSADPTTRKIAFTYTSGT
ncbi:RNB domain-containing ribonuclease [Nocardia sp. NPDC127579]|uniref:RNB domain-containing ribonuclease n=1 Tax=Nocardia sp. NPDC127579 TaxID=3345402 RepID=UPI003641B247